MKFNEEQIETMCTDLTDKLSKVIVPFLDMPHGVQTVISVFSTIQAMIFINTSAASDKLILALVDDMMRNSLKEIRKAKKEMQNDKSN